MLSTRWKTGMDEGNVFPDVQFCMGRTKVFRLLAIKEEKLKPWVT